MYGAIEAGGTKFVCAVSDDNLEIVGQIRIPTMVDPEQTMSQVETFFSDFKVASIGIGSFGPIGINPDYADYGFIKQTPKTGWENYNFLARIKQFFDGPVFWTTDVNVAAYGEYHLGHAKDKQHMVYLTVGTGIGGTIINNDDFYAGVGHPEIGHIYVKSAHGNTVSGVCPYHKGCLEGMASGPAILKRSGKPAEKLETTDRAWGIEAYYLAQAAVNYTLLYSPEIIIFGGGVANQARLFPLMRKSFEFQMGDYVQYPSLDHYLVHAKLGDDAGIKGALLLAKQVSS
ncbi:ROK family protein [Lactiplantibacillus daowaiensis]|uniref:fructokinase n=1 Tax=Lactiplantibacillus daowaiensis TaxID=2559918 RepID=A0ABW1S0J4_9LACO|nr:ROK family protein [Lactiplantibacillus daowaiensis]